MTGLGPLLRKELLEQWRTKRLLVVAVVFLLFGIASPLLARYTAELVKALAGDQFQLELPPPTVADAVAQLLKNVGQTGVLAAILLAMGSVASDKERGIAALFLTKPASRGAFLAAKLAAIVATLTVGVALACIAAYLYTLLLFEAPDPSGWLLMSLLLLLQLAVYAALTFLGSTLMRSAIAAAAFGVAALTVVALVAVLPPVAPYTPSGLGNAAQAIGSGHVAENLVPSVLANLALLALVGAASWWVFRRQEL